MIKHNKLRPLMLALLASLAVAGAVHADSGDEILKRRQQYTEATEKDMRGDGAFGRTRKEMDVRVCQQEMHYYASRGYLPSYNCFVLYTQDKANGLFYAVAMPTAEDYNARVTEHRALEKA